MASKFGVFVDEFIASFQRHTGYLCFLNSPISRVFIANSSSCSTTELSILLTYCLTAIKNHVINYCTTVYERNGKIYFGLLQIQVKFLIN